MEKRKNPRGKKNLKEKFADSTPMENASITSSADSNTPRFAPSSGKTGTVR